MKVKIFANRYIEELEKEINKFLEFDIEVIDIKFSTYDNGWTTALIVYMP